MKAIEDAELALAGLAYMFHPQEEWTGGDSSNPENYKIVTPHITRTS